MNGTFVPWDVLQACGIEFDAVGSPGLVVDPLAVADGEMTQPNRRNAALWLSCGKADDD